MIGSGFVSVSDHRDDYREGYQHAIKVIPIETDLKQIGALCWTRQGKKSLYKTSGPYFYRLVDSTLAVLTGITIWFSLLRIVFKSNSTTKASDYISRLSVWIAATKSLILSLHIVELLAVSMPVWEDCSRAMKVASSAPRRRWLEDLCVSCEW